MLFNLNFSEDEIKSFFSIYERYKKNELVVISNFQKIVDSNKRVIGYESLFRLKEKRKNTCINNSPVLINFFSFFKDKRYYNEINTKNLRNIFQQADTIPGKIFINISLCNDILNDEIYDMLKENLSNRYVLEILETDLYFTNIDKFEKAVKKLKQLPCEIALDDFGSGTSNFDKVIYLEPNYIKIDGSFVKKITDKKVGFFVKNLVRFAKRFNVKTIAEHIEDENTFNILKKYGTDYFQGWYFND